MPGAPWPLHLKWFVMDTLRSYFYVTQGDDNEVLLYLSSEFRLGRHQHDSSLPEGINLQGRFLPHNLGRRTFQDTGSRTPTFLVIPKPEGGSSRRHNQTMIPCDIDQLWSVARRTE